MTRYNPRPETIAEKDVTYIREEFKQNPTWDTIKRLAKEKDVPEGRILSYLGKLADHIRGKRRKDIIEANKRWREQRNEKARDRRSRRRYADYYTDEKLSLSPRTIKQVRLVPKEGKSLKILKERNNDVIKYAGYILKCASNQINTRFAKGVKAIDKPKEGYEKYMRVDANDKPIEGSEIYVKHNKGKPAWIKGGYQIYVAGYIKKYGKPKSLSIKQMETIANKIAGNAKSTVSNIEILTLNDI